MHLNAFFALCLAVIIGRVLSAVEGVPPLNHVFVIVGENTEIGQLTTSKMPYLMGVLAPQSAVLTNYWALTHYSLPNYIGLHSGQWTTAQQLDGGVAANHQTVDNLFNQLRTAGLTHTTWLESQAAPCYLVDSGAKATMNPCPVHHNPQPYFDNVNGVTASPNNQGSAYCQLTNLPASSPAGGVGMDLFLQALASNASTIANYNLIIPNACNDAHDNCQPNGNPLITFDQWLQNVVPRIQSYIVQNGGLLIILFDEGTGGSVNSANGGNVLWLAWGPHVAAGTSSAPYPLGHYSHLRTLQDGFNLVGQGYLSNATSVQPINGIWI